MNMDLASAFAESDAATRVAEAYEIVRVVEATHPLGQTLATNPEWAEAIEQLVAAAEAGNQAKHLTSVMALLATLNDGHTTVPIGFLLEHGLFPQRLPMSFRPFDDGLYVVAAKDEALPLLGGRVVRLGDEPIADVLDRFEMIWPGDNAAWAHHDLSLLGLPVLLEGLGVIENSEAPLSIAVELANGAVIEAVVAPRLDGNHGRAALDRTQFPYESWAAEAGEPNFFRRLPEQQAIYVRLGTVTNTETLRLVDLTRQISDVVAEPGFDRVVLDLRDNAGGNNILAERLRRAIMLSDFNRPGSLYVLIGPQTFSAGMNVATRFERDTFATFIGEPTGAGPNSYGDHAFQIAHATGLGYMVSTLPWFDSMPMDERDWILPDVAAPRAFDDWMVGHDAGLEAALAHTSERDIGDVYWFIPWERPSQAETWVPFWRR